MKFRHFRIDFFELVSKSFDGKETIKFWENESIRVSQGQRQRGARGGHLPPLTPKIFMYM